MLEFIAIPSSSGIDLFLAIGLFFRGIDFFLLSFLSFNEKWKSMDLLTFSGRP